MEVLTKAKDLFVDNGGQINFLLEGDNLAVLTLLEKTHKGKIDVIYIDPPYNTGNKDFVYDDSFVGQDDLFRHSKWLSFMKKRLEIAKELLKEDGVIFISIDDNEQANLRSLCDSVFGDYNFLTQFIWEKTQHFGRQKLNSYSNSEYVLCYSKQLVKNKIKELLVEYVNSDMEDAPLYNASNNISVLHFPKGSVRFNIKDGFYSKTDDSKYELLNIVQVHNGINDNDFSLKFKSRWSNNKVQVEIENGTTFWVKTEKFAVRAIYEEGKTTTVAPRQIIFTNPNNEFVAKTFNGTKVETNEKATYELNNLFGEVKFSYPKPVSLIKYLISMLYNESKKTHIKEGVILDFFAGSGTTGQAVMELNKEDGGSRKFILCTNNENNICRDITHERLKTVITGIRKDGSKYSDGLIASLKYQKVEFVKTQDKIYYEYADELLKHIKELVELENALNLDDPNIGILLTEEEVEKWLNSEVNETAKTIYLGHDVLLSMKQEEEINSRGIKVNIIPEYYYKELGR